MQPPRVSFVIPSLRERRADLRLCLAALVRETMSFPAEAVVVVEDDAAADGLAELGGATLAVRPVLASGGAARRRNAGWGAARAPVIACLDDDAEPLAGYGAALLARFEGSSGLLVQGAVWPRFEEPLPPELDPVAFSVGGFNRYGERRREEVFISANCAFDRAVLDRVGLMREDLGPGSGGLPWGDDTEWCARAAASGITPVFDEAIAVRHLVQAERVTVAAVVARAGRVGRTRARLEWDGRRPGAATLLHQRALAVWARVRPASGMDARLTAARLAGYADELARIRRGLPAGR